MFIPDVDNFEILAILLNDSTRSIVLIIESILLNKPLSIFDTFSFISLKSSNKILRGTVTLSLILSNVFSSNSDNDLIIYFINSISLIIKVS